MGKGVADYLEMTLFSYALSHLQPKDKVRFYYALKGRCDVLEGFIVRHFQFPLVIIYDRSSGSCTYSYVICSAATPMSTWGRVTGPKLSPPSTSVMRRTADEMRLITDIRRASHNFLFATLTQLESIQGPPRFK